MATAAYRRIADAQAGSPHKQVGLRPALAALSRLCQVNAMVQCSFPVAAVHGQRSIPTGGMAAMRTKLPFDLQPSAALTALSRLCQAKAMPQCSFPIAAVHGQRRIPTGGMAAVRDEPDIPAEMRHSHL